jgi:DNA-binding NarL/FixJ family response regulator
MIRVLVVDDQAIVRQGLRAMLQTEADLTVVGEAESGQQALKLARELAPDVVLMDVRMPGMDGLSALEQVKSAVPGTSVIMVTLYDNPEYLFRAVALGAAGYVLKDSSRAELVRAIRVTAEGGAIISPSLMPQLLREVGRLGYAAPAGPGPGPADRLSPREVEVLKLIAEGLTNQEIADRLIVSPTTVKSHVQNILQKLGASDRTQAAVSAVRSGLI